MNNTDKIFICSGSGKMGSWTIPSISLLATGTSSVGDQQERQNFKIIRKSNVQNETYNKAVKKSD